METVFNTFEVLITFLHRSKGYYKHHQEQIKLSKSIVCRFLEAVVKQRKVFYSNYLQNEDQIPKIQ